MSVTDIIHLPKANIKTTSEEIYLLLSKFLVLSGFVTIVFAIVPKIDLHGSRLFLDPVHGFELKKSDLFIAIRDVNRLLTRAVIGVAAILLIPNLTVVGLAAAVFSLNRVVLGAHFLSDVVVAWCLMLVLAVPLWRLVSRNAPQIDAIFARASRTA